MLPTKYHSQFTPDIVHIVVVKSHNEYYPLIGFFHHETGAFAFVESTSEIRTIKLEWTKSSTVSCIPHITQR